MQCICSRADLREVLYMGVSMGKPRPRVPPPEYHPSRVAGDGAAQFLPLPCGSAFPLQTKHLPGKCRRIGRVGTRQSQRRPSGTRPPRFPCEPLKPFAHEKLRIHVAFHRRGIDAGSTFLTDNGQRQCRALVHVKADQRTGYGALQSRVLQNHLYSAKPMS
jgi:hypothetical protein